ncbi:MAG: HEAT repeat domain-containing protein [Candidatus Eremiobacterota bacterium]
MFGILGKLVGSGTEMPDTKLSNKKKKLYKEFCSMGTIKLNEVVKGAGSNDETTRKMAVLALGKIGGKQAVEALIKAIGDPSRDVQENAIHSLIKIGELGLQHLIDELHQIKHSNVDAQANVAFVLGWIKNVKAVDPLTKALRHDNEWVRWNAAFALGKIGDRNALESLKKARDREVYPWVKEYMLNVLAELDRK